MIEKTYILLQDTVNMIYLSIQLLIQIVFLKYYIPECIVAHFMVQNVKEGRVIEIWPFVFLGFFHYIMIHVRDWKLTFRNKHKLIFQNKKTVSKNIQVAMSYA